MLREVKQKHQYIPNNFQKQDILLPLRLNESFEMLIE